ADLFQIAQYPAAQRPGGLPDEFFELDTSELMIQSGGDHADQLADSHIAAPQAFLGEDDRGEAGYQGSVQVEERTDLGPGRAGHDFGDRAGQPQITRRFFRLAVLAAHLRGTSPLLRPALSDGSNEAGTARGAGSPASARI